MVKYPIHVRERPRSRSRNSKNIASAARQLEMGTETHL